MYEPRPATSHASMDAPLFPIKRKHATRKGTTSAKRTTLARKAQRAMKYGGK